MLVVTLGATLLENVLAGKGARVTSQRPGVIRAGDRVIRTRKITIRMKQEF